MLKKKNWAWISLGVVAVISLSVISTLNPFSTEFDSLYQEAESPDGEYLAKLLYRENLAMTYGYYRVKIEFPKKRGVRTNLVEVAAEGLRGVSWSDRRTLVVTFEDSNDNPSDKTLFVKKPISWRDVKIEYQPNSQ